MKGIILAGGSGTRLHPLTIGVSKQMLPVYDKPMIYYPMSVLMMAGIKDVLVITTPVDSSVFQRLFGDGSKLGMNIQYAEQASPDGLAQAFLIAEHFIAGEKVCLTLGDNIFYGSGLLEILRSAAKLSNGATVFGYRVSDPKRYGVVQCDDENNVIGIEEKPEVPKSDIAVTGLYFYDEEVVSIAKEIKPSDRGELEITDVNRTYLEARKLAIKTLGRGYAWFDTGTYDSLIEAGHFVQTLQNRQGIVIACLEEIAFGNGWISSENVEDLSAACLSSGYGKYLLKTISDNARG